MGNTNQDICAGSIQTEEIRKAHEKIREIVTKYGTTNEEVHEITKKVKADWVGKGRDEFEVQYNYLIRKIDDFGDALQEIYEALVESEAEYQAADDELRKLYVDSTSK